MKIINLRKKIGASLLAVGMITPGAAYAAGVNVNLLVDPSFENVAGLPTDPTGSYDTKGRNSWSDGTQIGGTYRYEQDFDKPNNNTAGTGTNDPNLNPPNPGLRYFTSNYPNADTTGTQDTFIPGQVMQIVDVSSGASAAAIATGEAEFWISGWFGGYQDNASQAVLALDFLDTGGASLGTASITGSTAINHDEWNEQSGSGLIPVGTLTVEVSVHSDDSRGNNSAFVDLANFTIRAEVIPEPSTALLVGMGIFSAGAFSRKRKS